jgi:choline dehydrogenase-like flavoprotein
VTRDDGSRELVRARREVVLSAGAIDTPRLLLLSGIGPADELRAAGVEVVHDLPGVGRDLQDHPEALLIWEATRPVPPEGATDWDMTIMARVDPAARWPEVLMHVPLTTFDVHAVALGVPTPEHSISLTPNVTKPRSRGSIRLAGPDPDLAPLYDPAYLTDPEGYDEATLLAGVQMARRVAEAEPMRGWIARETFPGADVTAPDELRDLMRRSHHTVYHVSGTARMGADGDPGAVCDPELRVRGLDGLSVADASAFPSLTSINPMVTIFMLAERAAELVRAG